MTIEQVLVFHKIVELGSFKAAAAELHKTQPAISFAIKKLEEELQVELFDRSGYRPVLTGHGKSFFERSGRLLQEMQELEGLAQSFRNEQEPEISLSVDGVSPLPSLLRVFRSFSDRYPHTKLNLSFDILTETERKVLARESLFGITHFISAPGQLEVVPITFVRMLPVMNRELLRERRVRQQQDLLEIDQVVVTDRNRGSRSSFGLLDGGRKWFMSDSNFKREIILAGLGWGHLPEHSIEREIKEKKLVVLEFEDIRPRRLDINLIRLKKMPLGVVGKALWEELTALQRG
jgi:DNA-binding transcriptional LysR family regulator